MGDHSSESSLETVLPHASFLQRTLERLSSTKCLKIRAEEAAPVAVVALQRYLSENEADQLNSYDVTVTDGVWRAKCLLHPALNDLVHSNTLRTGADVVITQCSYIYNERILGHGYIRIEQLRCDPGRSVVLPQIKGIGSLPVLVKDGMQRTAAMLQGDVPLLVSRKHYLPLWNSDDPEGSIWTPEPPSADTVLDGEIPEQLLALLILEFKTNLLLLLLTTSNQYGIIAVLQILKMLFVHFFLPNSVQDYLSRSSGVIFSDYMEISPSSSENNTQIQIKVLWEAWAQD